MINNEFGTNIAELINCKTPIYFLINGFNVNNIKTLIRHYADSLNNKLCNFKMLVMDNDVLHEDMSNAINILVQRNIVTVEKHSDLSDFLRARKKEQSKIHIVVNSQDDKSAILTIAKAERVFIVFLRLENDGSIKEWYKTDSQTSHSQNVHAYVQPSTQGIQIKRFNLNVQPKRMKIETIQTSISISKGTSLYDSKKNEYRVNSKEMPHDGAASYGTSNSDIWVKIYDESTRNSFAFEKLKLMLSIPIECNGVCWPIDFAFDSAGTFRGFFYRKPKGEPMHLSILRESGIKKNFPEWNKRDLAIMLQTLLRKVVYLHDRNVLFGCINPAAIRIVSPTEIYLVDTDNYQIESFPSKTYNLTFTPPAYVGKKIYLSTMDDDNFAIAELVFSVMMIGKSPYGEGIISDPEKLIREMHFLYPSGKIHGSASLPGVSRFMWSHLTPFKYPLFETLQNGGKYNATGMRRDARFWLNVVNRYIEELNNPYDAESLKLFPLTFKRSPDVPFYKCSYCGVEHPDFFYSRQNSRFPGTFSEFKICNSCFDQKSDISFRCVNCNRLFYFTNSTAIFHKIKKENDSEWKDPKHCSDCKKKVEKCIECGKVIPYYYLKSNRCPDCNEKHKNSVYKRITCRECGRSFDFTVGEREHYARKGFNEPTRCPNCRKSGNRTGYNQTSSSSYGRNQSFQSNNSSSQSSSKRFDSSNGKKSLWDRLFGK